MPACKRVIHRHLICVRLSPYSQQGSTEHQKRHRTELMAKLRSQLEELEQCAQEVGREEGEREREEGRRLAGWKGSRMEGGREG